MQASDTLPSDLRKPISKATFQTGLFVLVTKKTKEGRVQGDTPFALEETLQKRKTE